MVERTNERARLERADSPLDHTGCTSVFSSLSFKVSAIKPKISGQESI